MSQQYPAYEPPRYDPPTRQFPAAPYDPAATAPYDPAATAPYDPAAHQFPGARQYDPTAAVPNYGAPTPFGFDARPEHPDANLVLILGVAALFTVVTGPFAWYFGSRARAQLRAQPQRWSPSTGLTVGWALGILTSLGMIAFVALMVFGMVALMALAA